MAGKDVSFKVSAKDEASGTLNKVAGRVNSFGKETKEALKPLDNLNKSFASVTKAFAPFAVAAAAGVAAIKKVTSAVNEMTDAWAADESAMKRIDFASTVNKKLAGTSTALKNLAADISTATSGWFGFGDVMEAMSDMLYDKSYDQIKQITEAAADLAVATGTDLNTAVTQLNNTFAGNAGQLGKMFPEIKKLTTAELEAGDAIAIVAERVKGASSAMADSVEGMKKAQQDASNGLKSALGESFSYLMKPMTDFFTRLTNNLAKLVSNANATKKAINGIMSEDAQTRYDAAQTLWQQAIDQRNQQERFLRNMAAAEGLTDVRGVISYVQGDASYQALDADISRYAAMMTEAANELSALAEKGYIEVAFAEPETVVEVVKEAVEDSAQAVAESISTVMAGYALGTGGHGSALLTGGTTGVEEWFSENILEPFKAFALSLESANALLDPLTVIINSAFQVLQPVIDNLLAPLIGALSIVGQTLGQTLVPLLEILSPVLGFVCDAFVFLYNKVLRPVSNGIISAFNMVYNAIAAVANGLIALYNAIPFVSDMSYVSYKSLDEGWMQEITAGSLATAGASYMGTMGAGGASYTAARDITVNLAYSHSFVNGDAREIAIQIKRELAAISALGY